MAIHGYPNTTGAGRRSITVDGYTPTIAAGDGFPVTSGDPQGETGGVVAAITAGPRWLPQEAERMPLTCPLSRGAFYRVVGYKNRTTTGVGDTSCATSTTG